MNNTGFQLEVVQTLNSESLKEKQKQLLKRIEKSNSSKKQSEIKFTLLDWYAEVLEKKKDHLLEISNILLVDAYFSKNTFVSKMCDTGFSVISRLRNDSNLRYFYKGKKIGKRGAPKKIHPQN